MNASNNISEYLSRQIHYKAEDILPSHIITLLRFDRTKYYGQVKSQRFTIWRYSFWSGIFYPVITGTINPESSANDVILKAHMNSAGMLLGAIVFALFFLGFPGFDLQSLTMLTFLFRLVFASLPTIAIFMGYSYQRRKFLTEISLLIKNVC